MSKRPAIRAAGSVLAVSGWPLRRKMRSRWRSRCCSPAPWAGCGCTATSTSSSNSSASAQQVTVLRPAVDYLTAAERAMVAAQYGPATSKAALDDAIGDLQTAAEDLTTPRTPPELTPDQATRSTRCSTSASAMRDGEAPTRSAPAPGWPSCGSSSPA